MNILACKRLAPLAMGAGLLLAGVGCESTEDSTDVGGGLTGTWLYSDTRGVQTTWVLVQSDDTTFSGVGTGGETVDGTINEETLYVNLAFPDGSYAYLNGVLYGDTMAGSGTFTTNSVSVAGSWTAVRTN